jgi:hypothetical protein
MFFEEVFTIPPEVGLRCAEFFSSHHPQVRRFISATAISGSLILICEAHDGTREH